MRNLKSFLKIQNKFNPCDENALKIFKNISKSAYFFWHFLKKTGYQGYKKMPKNAK